MALRVTRAMGNLYVDVDVEPLFFSNNSTKASQPLGFDPSGLALSPSSISVSSDFMVLLSV